MAFEQLALNECQSIISSTGYKKPVRLTRNRSFSIPCDVESMSLGDAIDFFQQLFRFHYINTPLGQIFLNILIEYENKY